MTNFEQVLLSVDTWACTVHTAEKAFAHRAQQLFALYQAGEGTEKQRLAAEDYLEDAELIPFRHRDVDGRIKRDD